MFLLGDRSIKVTLLPENLVYFPLDISPNCFFIILKILITLEHKPLIIKI